MIRVIIADDQLLFRSMLEQMLKTDHEIEITASCADGAEAVNKAMELKPDVVLLDIQMPNKSGMDALKEIKSELPSTKVVMLTTFENDENILTAINLNADGYLIKDMKPDVLIMAVKCIYNDMVLFNQNAYSALLESTKVFSNNNKQYEYGNVVFDSVDISIIKQITEGKTNREIASYLHYSEGTIKNRVSKILSMTNLSDRTEISIFAIKNKII